MRAREHTVVSVASLARRRTWHVALEGGLAHSGEIIPADPLPDQSVVAVISANMNAQVDLVGVYYTTDGSEPQGVTGIAQRGAAVMAERGEVSLDPRTGLPVRPWIARLPGQPDGTLVRYRIDGWSVRGSRRRWLAGATPEHPAGEVYSYHVDTTRPPAWFEDAVIYAAVVDRFSAAEGETLSDPSVSGYAGGTLAGLLGRLDYLRELGITCLWLLPVAESATFDGLVPASYFNVAEHYGTNAILRSLVGEAHERGLRVILSVPLFQVSREHPLYRRATAHPIHPIGQWFLQGTQGALPLLATEHPDVRRYLLNVASFWLGDLGADGLHFPGADGPSLPFWTDFQRELKARFPAALTLGSIAASEAEVDRYAGRLDAVLDYPLALHLRRVFATREAPLGELLSALEARTMRPPYGARVSLLDFLDLDRFLYLAEGEADRLALAATCQMTLEGTPAIFYGTEVGLAQERDNPNDGTDQPCPEACPPMVWDRVAGNPLTSHFARLVALRDGHPALRDGRRMLLPTQVLSGPADAAHQVGAYVRWTDTEYLVVALNNCEEPVTLRLPLAASLRAIGARVDDSVPFNVHLASGEMPAIEMRAGGVDLALPPLGAVIFGQG